MLRGYAHILSSMSAPVMDQMASAVVRHASLSFQDDVRDFLKTLRPGQKKDPLSKPEFEVTRLNDKVAGAKATILDAAVGPYAGRAVRDKARCERLALEWGEALGYLGEDKKSDILNAFKAFEKREAERIDNLQKVRDGWRVESMDEKAADQEAKRGWFSKTFRRMFSGQKKNDPRKLLAQQADNEAELFKQLRKTGIDPPTVAKMLQGVSQIWVDNGGTGVVPSAPDQVYVLDFVGDMLPRQGKALSEEITAILSLPDSHRPQEIILRLKSPGGTVYGYGLCGAELSRVRKAGIKLIVCVDEIAASGGYMMACVGDHVICAPFAMIGSIGVVTTVPNFANRMEKEGLKTYQITAGKYKRTLGALTVPTEEALTKTKDDLEQILSHFSHHITTHRKDKIDDMSKLATGEVWLGPDALSLGLVDELGTSEEYIQSRIGGGADVYHLKKIADKGVARPGLRGFGAEESFGAEVPMLIHHTDT